MKTIQVLVTVVLRDNSALTADDIRSELQADLEYEAHHWAIESVDTALVIVDEYDTITSRY